MKAADQAFFFSPASRPAFFPQGLGPKFGKWISGGPVIEFAPMGLCLFRIRNLPVSPCPKVPLDFPLSLMKISTSLKTPTPLSKITASIQDYAKIEFSHSGL